jgi:muramoyltetrapeptide carboxypeptidase
MGFRVLAGAHVLERDAYFAGGDADRAADLEAMWCRPETRAIWFARGGYGTARLLDRLSWRRLSRRALPLIGYSDVSALFAVALERGLGPCFYGPVVTELGDRRNWHAPSLASALAARPIELRLRRRDVLVPGRGNGRLVGGNLTVLAHLWGTRFQPDWRGSILFLEDVGEEAYRLDRTLTQLRTAGALRGLRGVLIGDLGVPPTRREFPPDRPVAAILAENFGDLGVPVVTGVPAGHRLAKWTLPLGWVARIDTTLGRVAFTP